MTRDMQPEQFSANMVIPIEGTSNFRSLEGYATVSGPIRAGALFRSDVLDVLTDRGISQVQSHNISRVVDLRHLEEVDAAPDRLPEGVEHIHLPLSEGSGLLDGSKVPPVGDIYQKLLLTRGRFIVEAVKLIVEAPRGGVLLHCTAGKDRTGLVIAIILDALGVSRSQTIADYVVSGENLAGKTVERMISTYIKRIGREPDEAVFTFLALSPPEALLQAFEVIDYQWGSSDAMLFEHGLEVDAFDRLQDRLT